MGVWIVLLRGVNVGGHNKLKMADFRESLTVHGFSSVHTYIQSGNIILRSDKTAKQVTEEIGQLLKTQFQIDVPILLLTRDALSRAIEANPFNGDFSRILLWFCFEPLTGFNKDPLDALRAGDEETFYSSHLIYLHAPSGIARSKLAEKIDRLTPVQLTARNLRTTVKLLELADHV